MNAEQYDAARANLPRKPGPKPGDRNVIVKRRLREVWRCTCGAWRYGRRRACRTCGEA